MPHGFGPKRLFMLKIFLWIIAHRYFMDNYAKYMFDNHSKQLYEKTRQNNNIIIINFNIYKMCPFGGFNIRYMIL